MCVNKVARMLLRFEEMRHRVAADAPGEAAAPRVALPGEGGVLPQSESDTSVGSSPGASGSGLAVSRSGSEVSIGTGETLLLEPDGYCYGGCCLHAEDQEGVDEGLRRR